MSLSAPNLQSDQAQTLFPGSFPYWADTSQRQSLREFSPVSAKTWLARERILKLPPNKVKELAAVETAWELSVRK